LLDSFIVTSHNLKRGEGYQQNGLRSSRDAARSTGDSLMAEFASAVETVRSAIFHSAGNRAAQCDRRTGPAYEIPHQFHLRKIKFPLLP
jgi:hypothetical protein